jgi:HSP20 family protein
MKTAFQVRPQRTSVQPTLNKFVNDFFNSSFSDIVDREFIITRPAVNVLEKEDAFELSIAAPGLSKEQFSIEVENDVLTIQANLEENNTKDQATFKRREFNYAGFKRTFKLNSTLDADQITATYEAGILNVSIPKVEKQTKKITIA